MAVTESSSLYNHDRVNLNHDTESDEEFDDTRIETPRSIRQDISGHNLTSSHVTEQHRDRDQIRSTTTTIPLKEPQIVDNNTETRNTAKYRINNGTPMAIRSNTKRAGSHNEGELSAVPSNLPEVRVTTRRSFSQYSSPLRKQISRRSIVDSPPSNLKIRPLDLSSSLYSKFAEKHEGIEKVSSPRSQNESLTTREPIKEYTNDSMDESTKGKKDTIRNTSSPEKVSADNQVSPVRSSNDFRSYDFDRDAVSRANLLERVNQTLDSIGNQDAQLEGSSDRIYERNYLRSGTSPRRDEASAKDTEKEYDVSSSSDFDGFIDKLNFKYRETSHILGNSTPKVEESSPKKPLVDIQRAPDNIKEAVEASKEDYEPAIEEIFRKNREQASKPLNHLRYQGKTLSGTDEWSSDKWRKLNRVVRSKAISRQEAINSQALVQTFGCASRSELAQRIDFLIKFNRIKEKTSLRGKGKMKRAAKKLKIGK